MTRFSMKKNMMGTLVSPLVFIMVTAITIMDDSHQRQQQQNDDSLCGCYRAAVLDHVKHFYENDPKNVIQNMNLNFQTFVDSAIAAHKEDVDLLVYPESGLVFPIETREDALKYSTVVPEPRELPEPPVLCKQNDPKTGFDLIRSPDDLLPGLSCLSLVTKMYLIANLLDRQPCSGKDCPPDGHYVFNTAVMFGRHGELLAKYHKMHPFGEMQINAAVDGDKDLIIVDTPDIGRIGIQICFDIIYSKPGHLLATNHLYDADTIVFPTEWYDEAPLLSGAQYQMAWAFGNQVNLIASDDHAPQFGTIGSGIYSGDPNLHHVLSAVYYNDTGIERLLISDVPIKPRKRNQQCQQLCDVRKDRTIQIPNGMKPKNVDHYYIQMNNTNVTLVELNLNEQSIWAEHNGVRCHVLYRADFSSLPANGKYYLLASNRTRPNKSYRWAEEFCAVTYCQNGLGGHCERYSTNDLSLFYHIKLTGTFSSDSTVYPSAVEFHHRPIQPHGQWNYWQEQQTTSTTNTFTIEFGNEQSGAKPMTTLALYGRPYARDPPYKQVPV